MLIWPYLFVFFYWDSQSSKGRKRKTSTGSVLSQKGQKSSTAGDKNETGKSSRRLRKRILTHELVGESEDEARDNGAKPAEPPINSVADEDRNRDDECKVKNLSRKKRAPRKSMKSVAENEKPVRKRKNANETGDKSTKEPPKKFSHSTRRKRRCGTFDCLFSKFVRHDYSHLCINKRFPLS